MNDPVEAIVHSGLVQAEIRVEVGVKTKALDFYLPDYNVYIECKRMFTERINDQISRHENVIVIQGMGAALTFVELITA